MDEEKELLELLENYIVHVRRSYEKKYPLQLNEELCLFLKGKVETITNNYSEFVNFDLSKIIELFPTYNENDLHIFAYYQFVLKNTKLELQGEDVKVLKNLFKTLSSSIDSYMNKINDFKKNRDNEILKLVAPYKVVVDKLNDDLKLNSEDIQYVYNIIKISNKNINDSIKIMRYLFNNNLNQNVVSLDVEEVEELDESVEIVEITNLTYDVLSSLFVKYNIDFGSFLKDEQDELLKYGNINNIEEILKKFLDYEVNISDYLEKRSQAIKNIFLYSSPVIITDLIDNFIKFNILKNENGKLDISLLLESPSRFLNRKRRWVRRKSNVKQMEPIDGVVGCYEDVLKNLEYFSKEGLDVVVAFEKSGHCFDFPHERILEIVRTFQLYNIDKEYYFKSLSCFGSTHHADVIDLFIELGYFDYLRNNMSRLLQLSTSPIFYKLARANQLGKKPKMYGKKMDGNITNDENEYLGIDKKNGHEITKQYVFEFDNKTYYDSIINSNESNSVYVALVAQKNLVLLMDKNYILLEENGYPDYRLYNIGGVLISRTKFLRVLNTLITNGVGITLETVMYALTRNSIITKEQFDIIYSSVSESYENVPTKKGGRR